MDNYMNLALESTETLRTALANRGLRALVSERIMVKSPRGSVWLFLIMDDRKIGKKEYYTSDNTTGQISAALNGKPVVALGTEGLTYGVLLSERPHLPQMIDYPGWKAGVLQVGLSVYGREAEIGWKQLGHVIVAGLTGSGKSTFLRLLTEQAIQEEHSLALADPDGRSFPYLRKSSSLFTSVGRDPDGCQDVLNEVMEEIYRRDKLYDMVQGFPDSLEAYNEVASEKLPRIITVIDEFNGMVLSSGGVNGEFSKTAVAIAWRGRKFGVNLVLAGQDFTKAVVGPVRDQMTTKICFQVANSGISRVVLNVGGAEKLKYPGRALTNRWGKLQTYKLDIGDVPESDGVTDYERDLAKNLRDNFGGRMTYDALLENGYGRKRAIRIRNSWLERGLAETRPDQDNALCIIPGKFQDIMENNGNGHHDKAPELGGAGIQPS